MSMSRSRFTVPSSGRTMVLLAGLLFVVVFAGACRNCPDRFCKAVRLLREQAVNLSDRCCLFPDSEGCGAALFRQFNDGLALVQVADDACHAGNLDLLKETWREFKDLVPANLILLFCEHYQDLDAWLEEDCRPYINTGMILGTEDTVDLDIHLVAMPGGTPRAVPVPGLPGDVPAEGPSEAGERTFLVTPGSHAMLDTAFGTANLGVSGSLSFGALTSTADGFDRAAITRARLDVIDVEAGIVGHLELDPDEGEGLILLDESGRGLLGMSVDVRLEAIDDPTFSLEGFIDRAWIELPVSLHPKRMHLGGDGPLSGLDVAPVHPEIRARLEVDHDDVPPEPSAQVDPCATEFGPDGRAWYQRSITWYWRVTRMFPECFPEANADGS